MADELKIWKAQRSETARKARSLTNRAIRICTGEVEPDPDTSLGELLLQIDDHWRQFVEEHNEIVSIVQGMEAKEPGTGVKASLVSGKSLKDYHADMKTHVSAAQDKLKAAILAQKEEAKKVLDEKIAQDRQALIYRTETRARKAMRSARNALILTNVDTEDLDEVRKWSAEELDELKVRIELLAQCLPELEEAVAALVALNVSTVHELKESAENQYDSTCDKLESIRAMVRILSPSDKPAGEVGRPEGPPRPYIPEVDGLNIRATSTPRQVNTSILAPGLQAKERRAVPTEVDLSSEEDIPRMGAAPKMYKFQALQFPTFNGLRRDWPAFRSAWKYTVEPQGYSPFYLAQQLRQSCKSGMAADLIRAITIKDHTSYELMWNRLENFYSDQGAVLASLYADLDALKPCRNDGAKEVIKFVNDLELVHELLHSISPEHPRKIDVNRVDKLAACLPDDARRMWDRQYHHLDIKEKESPFTEFVYFCIQERACKMRFLDTTRDSKKASVHSAETDETDPVGKSKTKLICRMDKNHTGHYTRTCKKWHNLSPEEKREYCMKNKLCIVCLDPWSRGHRCPIPKAIMEKIVCDKGCKTPHRREVVCAAAEIIETAESTEVQSGSISGGVAYTARYAVKLQKGGTAVLFADAGSDISFVNEKFARKQNFKVVGEQTLKVRTLTGTKEVQSQLYEIPLSQVGIIICHGVETALTGRSVVAPMESLRKAFPKYKGLGKLLRDPRPAEILLGLDYWNLHPQRKVCASQKLSIMRGALGDTLVGSEPKSGTNYASCHFITKEQDATWKRFIQGDELMVQVNPKCGSCKCGHCPKVGANYSFKGEQELMLIREGLTFDEQRRMWVAKCPWVRPPETCPDNRHVAYSLLKSTERRLERTKGSREIYADQIKEMVDRGACRQLSEKEVEQWQGPKFYLCHQAVHSKSKSTPVRVVFNSSLSTKGISLNDCLAKGPDNYLNCLGNILIRFREFTGVLMGDISKMFHAIALVNRDQHMHRFLWRWNVEEEPTTYVMTKLNMGNVSSPCTAMESLFQTGDRVKETEPEVSFILKESSYVDDLVHSCKGDPLILARKVHTILKNHGFLIKAWQLGGESQPRDEGSLFGSSGTKRVSERLLKGNGGNTQVLGLTWNSVEDHILVPVEINFSSKIRGVRSGPDLKRGDEFPTTLTKRTVLEQVGKIFDPLGLIGPHILKAKLLLRETWNHDLGWDDVLSVELHQQWIQWFKSCFELEDIHFERCTRPAEVQDENPSLVIFSDGSTLASGYAAYVRWEVSPDRYKCYLILAKNKIAPRERVSVPRLELNGALLGARGRKALVDACRYQFSRIIHLVDSETVLTQVCSLATKMDVYSGSRVGEVQTTCEGQMEDWFWVAGTDNISDWNTRGKSPSELGADSLWQNGPEFLQKPIEQWPIKSINEIRVSSPCTAMVVCTTETPKKKSNTLDFSRVSKWKILVKAVARVLYVLRNKNFRMKPGCLDTGLLHDAKVVLLKEVQASMEAVDKNYKTLGVIRTQEGLWAVGARGVTADGYHTLPVLIPSQHRCAILVMAEAHEDAGHVGRDATLAKCRQKYYMAQGAKIAKRVRERCSECRLEDKKRLTQLMGKVPLVSLRPAPVFNSVQLDLFGPWNARGEIQKRTTGKVWGVLFVCLASRAVHIEIVAGYSTEDFLMGFRRFGSLRGYPKHIYSDPGSQLVGADRELREAWRKMVFPLIQGDSVSKGTDWKFSPADSPHYQGLTESLIKSVKRAVRVMYSRNTRMSWQEYLTAAYQVADLINSRPIAKIGEVDDTIQVLTPNALLLGRNSSDNPGYWLSSRSLPRLSEVNDVVTAFWKKWNDVAKPALTLHKKWNTAVRNLQVGDVVLVMEESSGVGQPEHKLAKVVKADPGRDGKVRSCQVLYKNFSSGDKGVLKYSGGTSTVVKRCCQRLVLIVPLEELRSHSNDY